MRVVIVVAAVFALTTGCFVLGELGDILDSHHHEPDVQVEPEETTALQTVNHIGKIIVGVLTGVGAIATWYVRRKTLVSSGDSD